MASAGNVSQPPCYGYSPGFGPFLAFYAALYCLARLGSRLEPEEQGERGRDRGHERQQVEGVDVADHRRLPAHLLGRERLEAGRVQFAVVGDPGRQAVPVEQGHILDQIGLGRRRRLHEDHEHDRDEHAGAQHAQQAEDGVALGQQAHVERGEGERRHRRVGEAEAEAVDQIGERYVAGRHVHVERRHPKARRRLDQPATRASSASTAALNPSTAMNSFGVRAAGVTYPSGDPNFSVLQAFPNAFSSKESDPFLMCDDFGPEVSKGRIDDPDDFSLGWHPHRGQDLLTYMTRGVGRHGDSMGNREEFKAPSMQWITAGSGIEHAEGGGTPAGEWMQGFQIWINVPADRKMDKPNYGTNPPEQIPVVPLGDGGALGFARILAGDSSGKHGPFETIADVQIVDFTLKSGGGAFEHEIPAGLDNVLVYVYDGSAVVGDESVPAKHIIKLEPKDPSTPSTIRLQVAPDASEVAEDVGFGVGHGVKMLLFAGKKLNEPIAWHGYVFRLLS